MFCRSLRSLLVLGVVAIAASRSGGHEVDHYVVPAGKTLADLGPYWNWVLYEAVRDGVADVNHKIEQAHAIPAAAIRDARISQLKSPGMVASHVRAHLPRAWWAIEETELALLREKLTGPPLPEGYLLSYRAAPWESTYGQLPWVPDPRYLYRLTFARSSLIRIHGTYLGTDKIGHFIGVGYLYYQAYRASVASGRSHDEAIEDAVAFGKWGPLGERSGLGIVPTGVCSNADMVANYTGMKFFINLTEPVRLKGRMCPPMLAWDGETLRLCDHVEPDGPFFSLFVSNHLDEALNPSVFDPTIRTEFHRRAARHGRELLDWYAGNDPAKRRREYFDTVTASLRTYYGEDYGHAGDEDDLLTLGEICFPRRVASHRHRLRLSNSVAPASWQE